MKTSPAGALHLAGTSPKFVLETWSSLVQDLVRISPNISFTDFFKGRSKCSLLPILLILLTTVDAPSTPQGPGTKFGKTLTFNLLLSTPQWSLLLAFLCDHLLPLLRREGSQLSYPGVAHDHHANRSRDVQLVLDKAPRVEKKLLLFLPAVILTMRQYLFFFGAPHVATPLGSSWSMAVPFHSFESVPFPSFDLQHFHSALLLDAPGAPHEAGAQTYLSFNLHYTTSLREELGASK